jgi:hypothetical protein
MSYDDRDRPTSELVEMFLEEHGCLEGKRGLETLRKFLTAADCKQDTFSGMSIGNQIEEFLSDNPDAIEMLIKWTGEEIIGDDSELRQNIINELPAACPDCGYPLEDGAECEDCEESHVAANLS